jgi:hypothetical protein
MEEQERPLPQTGWTTPDLCERVETAIVPSGTVVSMETHPLAKA